MPDGSERADKYFRPIGEHLDSGESQGATPLTADALDGQGVTELESLCMNCQENGTTRLLLTAIPHFRQLIIASFECPHCGHRNNEVQPAGQMQDRGERHVCRLLRRRDIDRQIVKSEHCQVSFPELELEIPPRRGQLTTVEGLLKDTVADLEIEQPVRKHTAPESYATIERLLERIRAMVREFDDHGHRLPDETPLPGPLSVVLDDPAGNSYIEFIDSMADPQWSHSNYIRSKETNIKLGIYAEPDAVENVTNDATEDHLAQGVDDPDVEKDVDVATFPSTCQSCSSMVETNMQIVSIPYFKEVVIMATACDHCGYKNNEVKSGAAISAKGRRITLKVEDREDLSRDILKSETCGLTVPELDLTLSPGTLGGRFTSLEGLLTQVHDELKERVFMQGDSATGQGRTTWLAFLDKLEKALEGQVHFTLILDDPLAASYLQNPYAPDADPMMTIEDYERDEETNEELGLNDMVLEGYEAQHEAADGGGEEVDAPVEEARAGEAAEIDERATCAPTSDEA